MKNGDGVPTDSGSEMPEPPIGASHSGQAAVDHRVGSKRAPRVKRVTLDEMVGLLNRELRDTDRVDDGRTPMRLVMHSGPAEAPKDQAGTSLEPGAHASGGALPPVHPDGDPDTVDDLPRPPRVPTIPGTRLLAPTVPSDPPGAGPRSWLWQLKRAWPWIALGLFAGLLFGWPIYRHLIR